MGRNVIRRKSTTFNLVREQLPRRLVRHQSLHIQHVRVLEEQSHQLYGNAPWWHWYVICLSTLFTPNRDFKLVDAILIVVRELYFSSCNAYISTG